MKTIRSKILFICLLALAPKAFAEKSCHSLFALVHPTDAEIERTFYEMKSLASQRYSKDSTESNIARSLYNERLKQLSPLFTLQEIKVRLSKINPSLPITKSAQAKTKETHKQLIEDIELDVFLKEHGFEDINSISKKTGRTPLDTVMDFDNLAIFEVLIKKNVDIYKHNNLGNNALMNAASTMNFKYAELLIQNGADVNHAGFKGITPLMIAAQGELSNHRGDTRIVKLFLENNAEINARDESGSNALSWAASRLRIDTAKFLIEKGIDVHNKNSNGSTVVFSVNTAQGMFGSDQVKKEFIQILKDAGVKE